MIVLSNTKEGQSMINQKVYCVIMRGGTSKALFFRDNDLPGDEKEREKVILRAFGSPDLRQIDGLGGANSSTSKVAIISVSAREDSDVDYDFGQVSVDKPYIGKKMNCGNISSAVGPYAVDEGLVKAVEPITVVRIFNINTQKRIISYVPVKDGKTVYKGDFKIDGVPGTSSRIDIEFEKPGGAACGKTLPTGKPKDIITIDGGRRFYVSLVDAANPVVFVRAGDLGLKGTELPWEYEALPNHKEINAAVEQIRGWAAVQLGYVDCPAKAATESLELPKIAICTDPIGYTDATGRVLQPKSHDITARLFSMGKIIHAYMGTGTVCTIVAANIKGSVVNEIVAPKLGHEITKLTIGHPFGTIDAAAKIESGEVKSATIGRTARRLMEGFVYID